MLDFLQKSSGTRTILEAMDGCGCDKAVLIGMPCCKKWSKDEPEEPLYYQDDNGQLYVYSYCDQMIADAWLALPDDKRKRFAPVMASFNPTDINSINHVERMWNKYPGMWRGIGEVMCRHDDLTTLLQENETPCMNHVALEPMYEFCVKHGLNCMMHQNADRTAKVESNGFYEYQFEMEQVLEKFPELKLVWCQVDATAGIAAKLNASETTAGFLELRRAVDALWGDGARPLLFGPDASGFDNDVFMPALLAEDDGALDALTYHMYFLGSGSSSEVPREVVNATYLNELAPRVAGHEAVVAARAPRLPLILGEGGGAWNSGQHGVTDAFASGFWWLDYLGTLAVHGHDAVFRQALVGGNYGLLADGAYAARPDLFSSVL